MKKLKEYNAIYMVLIASALFMLLFYLNGYNPFDASNYSRWDSGLYALISEHGYLIEEIEGTDVLNGNCGWFPLYPFLTYAIGKILPLGFTKLGCIVSFCCFIASVHVFYHILGLDSTLNKELAVLLYLLNIGNIYFIAVFPMNLCILFWNLSILSILKKKYVISGICCFFASMSYSTAFLLCGILGLYIIQEWIKEKQKVPVLIGRILKSPFISFLGFIFVQIIIYIFTGNYKAFFLTQKKYGHGI